MIYPYGIPLTISIILMLIIMLYYTFIYYIDELSNALYNIILLDDLIEILDNYYKYTIIFYISFIYWYNKTTKLIKPIRLVLKIKKFNIDVYCFFLALAIFWLS